MRDWSSEKIRRTFLEFFASRGHEVVESSSLIPRDDPTLLFTNAGMVQFKRVFLQQEKRPYNRATSCQKCLRAGGKHNDLENVGRTLRHHTFFEMLGNFSFGDYFKREAIQMAWELLTGVFGLPEERLWVSIHYQDQEAGELWREIAGIPEERIVPLGDEDNFWAMGDTGPCGPCSEIIIDQGEEMGCGRPDCGPSCDCDRYLELWNLVFMQFERDQGGELRPLPRPCIDTGMGLERITAVLQGVRSNFDTDLFSGIIGRIEELTGVSYGSDPRKDVSIRVIADHARAVAFLVADGVLPSNEGRGYVLRRIIRRALRHGYLLDLRAPFLTRVIERVREKMSPIYPELEESKGLIDEICRREEGRFTETLERGLQLLQQEMEELKERGQRVIPGELAFKLYDTYGFPLDLTEEVAREEGFTVDMEAFEQSMQRQRERGKASWRGEIPERVLSGPEGLRSTFVGYEVLEAEGCVLAIFKGSESVEEAKEGEEIGIITDITPFYPEGGGQVGDRGLIEGEGSLMEVRGTERVGESILHLGRMRQGRIRKGQRVRLKVDASLRMATARNHTATHLLHATLREVLGGHVRQAGSLVEPKRLRFDFTHFEALSEETLKEIERRVNLRIMEDHPVTVEILDLEEALRRGALALFGEKYGERVRLVEVGEVSKELCGGTHVERTGQIGAFKILSESAVASGVRRIEAVTGEEAIRYVESLEADFSEIADLLGIERQRVSLQATRENVKRRIRQVLEDRRQLEEKVRELSRRLARGTTGDLEIREIKGIKVAKMKLEGLDPSALREMGDQIKARLGSGIVALGTERDGKGILVIMVTKDLAPSRPANRILLKVLQTVGGKGGGKETLAQGSLDPSSMDLALKVLEEVVAEFSSS
ncbi:MAG: alanine--tRNA ligase [Deltaproteobacteria bacterium]|nr:MAG: alanine--tRNA ligase [Deltaproteobacteria bacterium]